MISVTPRAVPGRRLVTISETELEYEKLVGSADAAGVVLTEWRPTTEEVQRLMCGGRLQVWTDTYGEPFQPVLLKVSEPEDCVGEES